MAGRDFNGCNDVCSGYTAGGDGHGGAIRGGGKLVVVEVFGQRYADRVFLSAIAAAKRGDNRY